jgi:hypothetical protein
MFFSQFGVYETADDLPEIMSYSAQWYVSAMLPPGFDPDQHPSVPIQTVGGIQFIGDIAGLVFGE